MTTSTINETMMSLKNQFLDGNNSALSKLPTKFVQSVTVLCNQFLTGSWENVVEGDLEMERVTGGNSNLIFKVVNKKVPVDIVLLRIFGSENDAITAKDTLVFSILSERDLGPKLLGVFPGGRLEEYIESRNLLYTELPYKSSLTLVAEQLAFIHCLEVPLNKNPQMMPMINNVLDEIKSSISDDFLVDVKFTKIVIDESLVPAIVNYQTLVDEAVFIEKVLKKMASPTVFSHNDIFGNNILVRNNVIITEAEIVCPSSEHPFVIIDYEYANYNVRGFDFGQIFCEFAHEYNMPELPGYEIYQNLGATDEQIEFFVKVYLTKYHELKGIKLNDLEMEKEVDKLKVEAKIGIQLAHYFWSIWNFRQGLVAEVQGYDFHPNGIDRLGLYYEHKNRLQSILEQ
uniref:Choline/ethanolamine kinase n=1 Tax=Rhabditophanes sp. KR3021 TaxID=114890 RepID=A0AC35TL06_9BILA